MSSFQERPFFSLDEARSHNTRLYRPVMNVEGSTDLEEFFAHAEQVLAAAGFTGAEVTLLVPEKSEVTIVSKGSINSAVAAAINNSTFSHAQTRTIEEVLLESLPGSARRQIPMTIGKIDTYATEHEGTKGSKYLAAYLNALDKNMNPYVGSERFSGYDTLRVLSGNNQVFVPKLNKRKSAAFRFAAFHNPNHLPTEKLIKSLMPKGLLGVILGAVEAGPFND